MSLLIQKIRTTLADLGIELDSFHYMKHGNTYHLHRSNIGDQWNVVITALVNELAPCNDESTPYYTVAANANVLTLEELNRTMRRSEIVTLNMYSTDITLEFYDARFIDPQNRLGSYCVRHYIRDYAYKVGDVFMQINVHKSSIARAYNVKRDFTLSELTAAFAKDSKLSAEKTDALIDFALANDFIARPSRTFTLYAGGVPLVVSSNGDEGCARITVPLPKS